ncbi:MAG: substrate-binding domain-containing protein [Chthonomonadales bacterium]
MAPQSFPAAVRVRRALEAAIANGHYAPGAWLPSERVLADEFGVSRPVVRAALAALQDRGLLERRPGCRPVVLPSGSHRTGADGNGDRSQRTIAVILPHHPTYVTAHAILRGVTSVVNREPHLCRLAVYDTNPSRDAATSVHPGEDLEVEVLHRVLKDGVAGMIVWHSGSDRSLQILSEEHRRGLPIVYVDRYPEALECDFVGVDNREGVRTGVEYLFDLGHRRILYAGHDERVTTVMERRAGFVEAFAGFGLPQKPEQLYTFTGNLEDAVARLAKDWLSASERPTAIVFENDLSAFRFMRAAGNAGIRIPRDVSIVGFDDVECYSPHPAILTTIHQPFWQIGKRAAELLLLRMRQSAEGGPRTFRHVILPTTLMVRSTTASPGGVVTAQRRTRRKE